MKRIAILTLALIMLAAAFAGCRKQPTSSQIVDIGGAGTATADPSGIEVPTTVQAPVTPKPRVATGGETVQQDDTLTYGVAPAARVDATAAYIFDNGDSNYVLYAAVEYTSTGDCPAVVSTANIVFTAGGKSYSLTFTPPLSEYGPVLPGESAYMAVWHSVKDEVLTADAAISVAVTLNCVKGRTERTGVTGSSLYITQNYPDFATLTGKLTGDSAVPAQMNMVYCAFYDESGKLLGVWYFTKNAQLPADEKRSFAVQLRALPIPGLADNTAEILVTGFGMS